MEITLKELAQRLDGKIVGDENLTVTAVAGLEEAQPSELSFLANSRYQDKLATTQAAAVIVSGDVQDAPVTLLIASNPYVAFARALEIFRPEKRPAPGISSQAWIDPTAEIGVGVSLFPFTYIGQNARIGARTVLHPFVYVGDDAQIGEDCRISPQVNVGERCIIGNRVTLHSGVVVGADGFGFAQEGPHHIKIPQVGIVCIEDDVEIGANTCVDRATMGETRIGKGSKIDNLVQVAHNVQVGEDVILVSQTGISGSTSIGDRTMIGGQVGVVGHVQIGSDVKIGAKSGVHSAIPDGKIVGGIPTMPYDKFLKTISIFKNLPKMRERLIKLEKEVKALKKG